MKISRDSPQMSNFLSEINSLSSQVKSNAPNVYNEVNEYERRRQERESPPEVFFNSEGNPFLGFMRFLNRRPVPPKVIDEQRLLADFSAHAHDRRNVINSMKVLRYILVGLIAVVFIFLFINPSVAANVGFIMPIVMSLMVVVSIVCSVVSIQRGNKRYYSIEDYKSYVINKAVGDKVEELVYEPHFGLPKSVFKDLRVISSGNRYNTEDLITGKHNGVYFAQCDLTVKYHSSGKHSSTTIYFKGRWIVMKYPKSFRGTVLVTDKNQEYIIKHRDFEEITLENPYFNEAFSVQASDMQLAYYLLTPQLMERIMQIGNETLGNVVVCFKDSYIHIGINDNRNSFEPNIKAPSLYDDINAFKRDFKLVSDTIEALGIDDNNVYNAVKQSENMPYSDTQPFGNAYSAATQAEKPYSSGSGVHIQGGF